MFGACAETVSILSAIIFGAGEACISIDLWSILSAFGAFMVLVVVAQFGARKLWARMIAPAQDLQDDPYAHEIKDDPDYKDSAIRSTRR